MIKILFVFFILMQSVSANWVEDNQRKYSLEDLQFLTLVNECKQGNCVLLDLALSIVCLRNTNLNLSVVGYGMGILLLSRNVEKHGKYCIKTPTTAYSCGAQFINQCRAQR